MLKPSLSTVLICVLVLSARMPGDAAVMAARE